MALHSFILLPEMMKILYIGNKLSKYGFAPTTVETLGRQLEEYYDVISVSDKKNKALRVCDIIISIIREKHVDYVLIDTYSTSYFYIVFIASSLCRFLKIKYIPILHGGNLPQRLEQSPRLSRKIFDNSYINVSPSEFLNYEFKRHGYNKVVTIPNHIIIEDYKFINRVSLQPKLLWVRSFDKTYNCEMAVDVLRIISAFYPDAILCMVGPDKDGSMQRVKDFAIRSGVSERLLITGKLSRPEWHNLSEEYDIFINTSNYDNMPVSVIEAMALGLPVVSTNVGGVPYLINNGEDGFLCEKDNAKDMAEIILRLLQSPETCMRICTSARKKVEAFDWKVVKEQWRGLIG